MNMFCHVFYLSKTLLFCSMNDDSVYPVTRECVSMLAEFADVNNKITMVLKVLKIMPVALIVRVLPAVVWSVISAAGWAFCFCWTVQKELS